MSSAPKKKGSSKKKRGRKPESLKIDGDWKDAVKTAFERGKPPTPPKEKTKNASE
jgi:hypothetical protein